VDDDREEDDEQLVIDDGNDEDDDDSESDAKTKKLKRTGEEDEEKKDEETPPMPSVFDLPTFMSNMLGQQSTTRVKSPITVQSPTESASTETNPQGLGSSEKGSTGFFSKHLFGDNKDPEERAAFYRDIIRNPFKAHSGDADDSNDVYSFKYTDPHHSNSNSRSLTPTPTPEPGSQSPKSLTDDQLQAGGGLLSSKDDSQLGSTSIYSRMSMYDYDPTKAALEDARAKEAKRERDRDIDMRLPFIHMKHYQPATEIDAAIYSHVPIRWQLQELLFDPPNYAQLRLGPSHKGTRELRDPRMRRILGLPELPEDSGSALGSSGLGSSTSTGASGTTVSFTTERRERKTSNCISSPDSHQLLDSTPSSPPSHSNASMNVHPPEAATISAANPATTTSAAAGGAATDPRRTDPRRDPRRAHLNTSNNSGNYAQGVSL